ncbi:MAG: glycosyltransferase family 61 protein [Lentisphaerae bacterium]|nr:glycosyltransferase family 61 protein [Lentisphaerota bacterium]
MQARQLVPPSRVRRRPPLNWEDDSKGLDYLCFDDEWGAANLFEFSRVHVSPIGTVFKRGRVIPETVDYTRKAHRNAPTFYKKILCRKVRRISGTAVVVHNTYFKNFYHWMLEALPRLFLVRDMIGDATLILCDDVEPFHEQTLRYYDFKDLVMIKRDELAFADRLLFPSPHYEQYGQHNAALLSAMAGWMREKDGRVHASADRPEKVFVSREPARSRRLANRDEVADTFREFGFVEVVAGELSIPDQVDLFSGARQMAGVHGAGLANIIHMKSPGLIVEIVNEEHRHSCFFNLASALGHDSIVLQCPTTGNRDNNPKYYDMQVPVEKLRGYLDRYSRDA